MTYLSLLSLFIHLDYLRKVSFKVVIFLRGSLSDLEMTTVLLFLRLYLDPFMTVNFVYLKKCKKQ